MPTWHEQHTEAYTTGQRIADSTARVLGSWPFIITQTAFVAVWISLNVLAWRYRWDPYPFILLNLMFSVQAAYAGPVLIMSQNRAAERDRFHAQADADTDTKAECEIENMQADLSRIEAKLDRLFAAAGAGESA